MSDANKIPTVMRPKQSLKIMVPGGINRYGKTDLHVIPDKVTVNGNYYRKSILSVYQKACNDRTLFPKPDKVVLMQNGAPAHTARETLRVIYQQFAKVWVDWPGNSPDLNPVEHIWSRLQSSVLKNPRPRNREQLVARVEQEGDSINQEELKKIVESFRARIFECLQNNGHHSHY